MARGSGLAPYRELASSMKGRPFHEIQAAMRDLKRELGGGTPVRRNPSGQSLLMYAVVGGMAYWLYQRHKQATIIAPAPINPVGTQSNF